MSEISFFNTIYSNSVKMHNRFFAAIAQRNYRKRYPDSRIYYPAFIDDACTLGKNTVIFPNVTLSNVTLGDYSYTSSDITNATIGKFCSISPGCVFGLGKHPARGFVSTHPAFYSLNNPGCPNPFSKKEMFDEQPERIIIGNDVWIGYRSIVMGGVRIGNGVIISAGAVVTKDVEDFAIVGGVPAKFIRYRFTQEQVDCLNRIRWWDKSVEWIRQNSDAFSDIETFCSLEKIE